ncbi:type II secretion system protein [Shewanella sp. GXUN23E]|uniref:type II secretion system protein n=1 Tax=Shewanella sp. GXUN23E TaxID=3422498 RepID=UPI003D7E2606
MERQQGFTLIELVVVIIILGILAVTAAPKFINLQSDARASALDGLKGAIQGANSLVYSKAALQGKQNEATGTVDIKGTPSDATDDIATRYGYMNSSLASLTGGTDVSMQVPPTGNAAATADWIINAGATPDAASTIYQVGAPNSSNTCQLTYTPATAAGAAPVITIQDSGC